MSDKSHLIERAADRLRETGALPVPGLLPAGPNVNARVGHPGVVFPPQARPATEIVGRVPPETQDSDVAEAPSPTASVAAGVITPPVVPSGKETAGKETAGLIEAPAEGDSRKFIDIATLERGGLVVGRKSRTRISEEFRITVGHVLRTLQSSFNAGVGAANLIMITSARPGEGKSFTALNLAGSIAQQNQREILLVDCDAKQRPITYELGLGDRQGLLDLVSNPALKIEDVILRTAIPNLSFLPVGTRVTGDAELTASRPITTLVERIGRRFANRVIILDAPPCLSTSDPSMLAPLVGQAIMVVEAERTQRNELEAALDLVKPCPIVTLLLNKIQLTTSYTFGAYHYFGTYT